MKLNVYNENGEVIKTCEAKAIDLEFGTIRSLMELLNIENINDTFQLLKTVYDAWEQVTVILSKCFPEIEDDEWEHVKVNELLPVIVDILKYSFTEMLTIPNDSKN